MTFGHWQVLILLFVPLAILVWVWNRRGRRVVLPQDYGTQPSGRWWRYAVDIVQSIPALLLVVAILLLAGPRISSVPRERRVLTNIEFCLDVSGSMATRFGAATAYDAAMEAIHQFVDQRPGDAFGLTLASSIAVPWVPLTQDASAFKCAAPFVRPENMWMSLGGGTMLGVGVRKCQEQLLQREEGDRMIIMVSDGMSFDLEGGQDEAIGRELRDHGIVVYYVHIGNSDPPASTAALATITGGTTFAAGDERGLRDIFQRIDAMRPTRLERTYADVLDFYWPFSLVGSTLLGTYLLSLFGLRYTPW